MDLTKIYIGTSGWHYGHWLGPFYPKNLEKKEMLNYYLQFFSTTEINNSFYKLPAQNTFQNWAETVPKEFTFSVKANRYITHMKKLKNADDALHNFLDGIKPLKNKLGAILFQLPPNWKCNIERLKAFLELLPSEKQYAFEFRNSNWWNEAVYDLLKDHGAAFCIFELAGVLSPIISTADFIYIRLHGPNDAYQGLYSEEALQEWADRIAKWTQQQKIVYCYFDNDQEGFAVRNALRLKQILKNYLKNK